MLWYTMWCHRWDHIARPMILNRCSFETCALPLYITSSSLFWALLSSAPSSRQDLERKKNISTPCFELMWARRNELKVAQNPRFCAQSQSANALLRQKKKCFTNRPQFWQRSGKDFLKIETLKCLSHSSSVNFKPSLLLIVKPWIVYRLSFITIVFKYWKRDKCHKSCKIYTLPAEHRSCPEIKIVAKWPKQVYFISAFQEKGRRPNISVVLIIV